VGAHLRRLTPWGGPASRGDDLVRGRSQALCEHWPVSDAPAPPGEQPRADDLDELPEDPDVFKLRIGDGKRLPRWVWRLILAVAFSVAVFQFSMSIFGRVTSLLGMVAVALFLSFAIEPAVNFLADRGWRRSLATLFCFFVLGTVTLLFVFVMAELVVSQVQDLVEKAPDYLDELSDWSNDTFGTDINTSEINDKLKDYQSDIAGIAANVGGRVLSITGSLLGTVFQLFTVALFAFYMTSQGPQMRRNLCSVLPANRQRTVLLLWELAIEKTGGWIYSRILLAVISAAATWMFLAILGVPSPLALAIWVGLVSQFIPAIGTYLAGALPVLIALLNDPIDALWVVGFIAVYQQLENYLLSPRITARTMELHPAVAFGAALAGGMLAGPVGAVLALPIAGVLQAIVSTVLDRHEVIASHLTELEHIEQTEGDTEVRRSMRRILRAGGTTPGSAEEVPAGEPTEDPEPPPRPEADPP
jgi:predicted PurR-regulated permease PerM